MDYRCHFNTIPNLANRSHSGRFEEIVARKRTSIENEGFCIVQCASLSMYIMVVEVVCTDLLASLSYLGLYHILLLSADKPSLKDQKTFLPQRSRTKELLFTISDGSYMGQNTRQGNSRS